METTEVITIFAPIMPLAVALLKWLFPEEDPRMFAVGFSIIVALGAGLAKLYFGDSFSDVLGKVALMSGFIYGVGTGLYKLQK